MSFTQFYQANKDELTSAIQTLRHLAKDDPENASAYLSTKTFLTVIVQKSNWLLDWETHQDSSALKNVLFAIGFINGVYSLVSCDLPSSEGFNPLLHHHQILLKESVEIVAYFSDLVLKAPVKY